MLISFTVGNFRSFAEPQTLSMVAAKDDAHPEHVVDCGTFGLLRAAALYGANASGKSNLVKAFRVVKRFGDQFRDPDDSWRCDPGGRPVSAR